MPRKDIRRSQMLSQFFTNDNVACALVDKVKELVQSDWNSLYFIEPAAGDGAFIRCLPRGKSVGVEVDEVLLQRHPEYYPSVLEEGGFLSVTAKDLGLDKIPSKRIVVIGNPPYSVPKFCGRSKIIALDFINHAATMGDTVAMILGNTFRRPTTQAKIDPRLHLIYDIDLDPYSFTMDDEPVKVTTVFQVWQAKYDKQGRPIMRPRDPIVGKVRKGKWGGDWHYVSTVDPTANIRICNWGTHKNVGDIDGPEETARCVRQNQIEYEERKIKQKGKPKIYFPDQSHHYICAQDPEDVYRKFKARRHLFKELAFDRTMGQNPDLSYADVLQIYLMPEHAHYEAGKWIH